MVMASLRIGGMDVKSESNKLPLLDCPRYDDDDDDGWGRIRPGAIWRRGRRRRQ